MADDCIGIKSSNGLEDSEADDGINASGLDANSTRLLNDTVTRSSIRVNLEPAKSQSPGTRSRIKVSEVNKNKARKKSGKADSGRCIGIDLGTTMSAVAFIGDDGRPDSIRSSEGELTTPSAVYFDDTQPLVGREALRAAEFDPSRMVRFAKRHLGQPFLPKQIENRVIPPVVLQATLLRSLRIDAEAFLGPVTSAAIAVPAYFNEPNRQATRDAGLLAGFQTVDIINEPTAAAIAYGRNRGSTFDESFARQNELVMVYDLGGGTFDTTLMEVNGIQFDAIATAGDSYLGGMDWDRRLVDYLADLFQEEKGIDLRENDSALLHLGFQAEDLKKSLATRESTQLRLGLPGKDIQKTLSRREFESITKDLLDRTIDCCRKLLRDSGLEWRDLDRLILVGGSTRMPAIQERLQNESGLPLDDSLSPDESVAHGAAIYADSLATSRRSCSRIDSGKQRLDKLANENSASALSIDINNVNSHDLGVMGIEPRTGRSRLQIMIPKNSKLPAARSKQFLTAKEGQKSVVVQVFEGEANHGIGVVPIGQCVVGDLPDHLPKGTCVLVTFRYTTDGRLSVEATLPDIDVHGSTSINRINGLDQTELTYWKKELDRGLSLNSFNSRTKTENSSLKKEKKRPPTELAESVVNELDELLDRIEKIDGSSADRDESPLSKSDENGIQDQNLQDPPDLSDNIELREFLNNLDMRN